MWVYILSWDLLNKTGIFDLDILETLVVRSMFPKSLEKAEVAVGFNYAPLSQLVKSSTWIEANKLSVYSPPPLFNRVFCTPNSPWRLWAAFPSSVLGSLPRRALSELGKHSTICWIPSPAPPMQWVCVCVDWTWVIRFDGKAPLPLKPSRQPCYLFCETRPWLMASSSRVA